MSEVFWTLNEKNFNPRILYPAKLSFKSDRAIKVFYNKQKQKQYITTKLPLQMILQGILHGENEGKQNHERTGSTKPHENKKQQIRE
jgi:nucleoside diphosphate kinase